MAVHVLPSSFCPIIAYIISAKASKHITFDLRVLSPGSPGNPVLQDPNAVWVKCVHFSFLISGHKTAIW